MASIRDLMTSNIETVRPDQTAREAASFMLSADTGSIPVCDGERIVGMITDRDIVVEVVAAELDPRSVTVGEIMSTPVVTTAAPSRPVARAQPSAA